MNTTALILAAGQGTRLRPLTDNKPKCLVELAGRSLLQRQIDALHHAGVEDIHVITGYRSDQIEILGHQTAHNPEFASTNMVASLFAAESQMVEGRDLVIVYGDIVFEPRIVNRLLAETAPLSTTVDTKWHAYWSLRMDDPLEDAETLKLSEDGHILEIGGKPEHLDEIEAQYMGLIKVRGDHVGKFVGAWHGLDPDGPYEGRNKRNMFMTSFLTTLLSGGWKLKAVPVASGWLEVDAVSDLELYHAMEEEGRLSAFHNIHWRDASHG